MTKNMSVITQTCCRYCGQRIYDRFWQDIGICAICDSHYSDYMSEVMDSSDEEIINSTKKLPEGSL